MPVVNPHFGGSPYFNINGAQVGIYVGENGEEGGIQQTWGEKGLELNVAFTTPWATVPLLLQGLRGRVSYTGESIQRTPPWTFPNGDGLTNWNRFLCDGTGEITGIKWRTDTTGAVTGLAGWGYYQTAIVPAHFSVPTYQVIQLYPNGQNDPSGMPYTTTTFSVSGEVFMPPSGTYRYEQNKKVLVEDAYAGIARTRTEIKITRHYMPIIPLQETQAVIGAINSYPMTFADYTYPIGSILLTGYPDTEPYSDPVTGLLVWDLHYQLLANAA